jgi:hypothetical protein
MSTATEYAHTVHGTAALALNEAEYWCNAHKMAATEWDKGYASGRARAYEHILYHLSGTRSLTEARERLGDGGLWLWR